jgi:hypothetical protein
MRLSDAGVRRRQAKLIYLNHRPPPWLTEDATRDRSNRLLEGRVMPSTALHAVLERISPPNAYQHRSKTDADQRVPPTEHMEVWPALLADQTKGSEWVSLFMTVYAAPPERKASHHQSKQERNDEGRG